MATKTYLELVNDVLIRLREDSVGTVTYSTYSTLIGKWVNDAKRLVEDLWDWQALATSVNVNVIAGLQDYTLSGLNERARLRFSVTNPNVPMAYDITANDKFQLIKQPIDWIYEQRDLLNIPQTQDKPIYFGLTKTAGGVQMSLFELPTATIRNWRLYFVDPTDDLSGDTDTLAIPYAPVVQVALDYALNERGEEIGEPGTTVEQKAMVHIINAVAIDAQEQPHKTTFYPN